MNERNSCTSSQRSKHQLSSKPQKSRPRLYRRCLEERIVLLPILTALKWLWLVVDLVLADDDADDDEVDANTEVVHREILLVVR